MAKRTDYSKEVTKTAPKSVRFNIKQFEKAKQLSGLESHQQLVDFLLDSYIRGENPVTERNYENRIEEFKFAKSNKKSYDGTKNTRILSDEAGQLPSPTYDLPIRIEGESGLDYKIRVSEYQALKNKTT